MLKKTNLILIGKKGGYNMIGKKSSGSHKNATEKMFNNVFNVAKSPLEK